MLCLMTKSEGIIIYNMLYVMHINKEKGKLYCWHIMSDILLIKINNLINESQYIYIYIYIYICIYIERERGVQKDMPGVGIPAWKIIAENFVCFENYVRFKI